MKRLTAFLLVAALSLGCAACGIGGGDNTQNSSDSQKNTQTESETNRTESNTENDTQIQLEITDANEILTKVWETYQENEKFAAVGGHFNSYKDGGPAKYDITQVEDLEASFCIPQESIAMVDDVATLQHGMNVNNFSAAAYHLVEGTNMQALIDDIKNMTVNNQWICGFPERLVIITVGDAYVVTAFGSGDIVDNFKTKLLGLYDNVPELVVDEDL